MSASEEHRWRYIPVEADYIWPPITSRDDHARASIDDGGKPWIDGHRVNVAMHRQFMNEWSAWFDAHEPGEEA